jgi:o-succinylbenzoate synthase
MRIEQVELREIQMPLKAPFETSFGVTQQRRIVLVTVYSQGEWGIGEVSCNEGPGYSYETTDTAWLLLEKFLVPAVLGQTINAPSDLGVLFAPFRGHPFAKAGLEMAVWDWFARSQGQALWHYLGGSKQELPVGLSVGIKKTPEELAAFVKSRQEMGYRRIKLKIAPGRDQAYIRAAREALGDYPLTVDANSAYTLENRHDIEAFDEFGLQYIEQPLSYDDLIDHSDLATTLKTPLCLDEPIHSVDDVIKAHKIGAGKIINLKLGRVGGYAQALAIAEYCQRVGLGLWCGGMLESGVGRAHNVALQTLSAFNYASDTAPSNNYWHEDIIEPEVVMENGLVKPFSGVGIGVALRQDRIEHLTERVVVMR